jgi:hypothetical protein
MLLKGLRYVLSTIQNGLLKIIVTVIGMYYIVDP